MQPNYRRRHPEVFAHKAERDMTVMHNIKGEQHTKKGDWLIGTEKGKIEVLKPAAFEAQFEPIIGPPLSAQITELKEKHEAALVELENLRAEKEK